MPLIELLNTTKLRSLGFGHDQLHGGSSSQPYVQVPIPTKKELDKPSPDFLLRGATSTDPFISVGRDFERIGKWFFSSKGLLFTAKQTLLSRVAAATDVSSLTLRNGLLNGGRYLPTSTLAQIGVSAFGLHLNKQGFNPIPSDGPSATLLPSLQDILSIGSQPLYGEIAYQNNIQVTSTSTQSKLLAGASNLLERFKLGKKVIIPLFSKQQGINVSSNGNNFLVKLLNKRLINASFSSNIYEYPGGPGSLLGIGHTGIKFATDAGGNPIRTTFIPNKNGFTDGGALAYTHDEIFTYGVPYQVIENGRVVGNTSYTDFRQNLRSRLFKSNKDLKDIPIRYTTPFIYTNENKLESRTLIGDPGIYNTADPILGPAIQAKKQDKLNSLPIFTPDDKNSAEDIRKKYDKDLITFKIQVINNDKPNEQNDTIIYFRAFLDGISDAYTSEWDSIQYVGRGEKFYNYKGFDRQISLGWTVAAQSQAELMPMYERLNYLASVCAPDYSANGYMRGNLVKLTIGGYIYEQVGIIKGFSYEMKEEYPWEIGLSPFDNDQPQLSQVIKVNGFQFIPIHSQVPRKGANVFIHRKVIPTTKSNKDNNNKTVNPEQNATYGPEYQQSPIKTTPLSEKLAQYNKSLAESLNAKAAATKDALSMSPGALSVTQGVMGVQQGQGQEISSTTSQVTNPDINSDRAKAIQENLNKELSKK
jgi:hypothetical protein